LSGITFETNLSSTYIFSNSGAFIRSLLFLVPYDERKMFVYLA